MKIAYLSHGNSVFDRRFLAKMVERGYQPHLISYWPDEPEVDIPGVANHYYYLPFPRFKLLPAVMHLRELLKSIRPDVLHTTFVQHHGFYGALSGFHPTLSMPWGSDILVVPDESLYGRWVTRFTLKRADMITCDCELVKQKIMHLVGYPAEKIVVFPWGIDLETFRPERSVKVRKELGWEHKKVLICTRNFDIRAHGVEYFILAIPSVLERCPDVRVILVGSGPLEPEYRGLVSELSLGDIVHFAGWLNEVQMAEHLNAADLYVSTSLSDGTSASLLEAMACGLPVVVSDVPSNSEWVEDGVNGYIVARKDESRLAEALVKLLKNPQLQKEMGERNLQVVRKRADWEKNFDVLESIYRHLVEGAR